MESPSRLSIFLLKSISMHEFVCFNRKIVQAEDASLSALSSAAFYGKGVFTTVAVIDKKPFLWEKHWRRLNENADKLKLDLSNFSEAEIKNSLLETIEKNNFINGRARITFFDESTGKVWNFENNKGTSFLITSADSHKTRHDFRLTVSPYRINSESPLAGVKSCNYLEKILAFDEAKMRGFDEAIQLNERGEIVSACMANVFWLKDGKLFTPSLKTGCLRGTMRDFVMKNLEVSEVESDLEVLEKADAIFLTSAGIRIVRVCEFDEKRLEKTESAITKIIRL